jgi:hypothetical protein
MPPGPSRGISLNLAASFPGTTYPTASRLVTGLEELGILRDITGPRRSRIYRYETYVSPFNDPLASEEEAAGLEAAS